MFFILAFNELRVLSEKKNNKKTSWMISCRPCGGRKRFKQVNGWYLAGKQKGCRAAPLCSTCQLCLKEILPRHFEQLRHHRRCCFPQCKEAGVTNEALCLFSLKRRKKKFPKAQMIMSRRGGRREGVRLARHDSVPYGDCVQRMTSRRILDLILFVKKKKQNRC